MKGTVGLTRQQRRSKSKLPTPTRKKKTEEQPSVRKRDGSAAKETRGGSGAAPFKQTMTVEGYLEDRHTLHQWYMRAWGEEIGSMEHKSKYTTTTQKTSWCWMKI